MYVIIMLHMLTQVVGAMTAVSNAPMVDVSQIHHGVIHLTIVETTLMSLTVHVCLCQYAITALQCCLLSLAFACPEQYFLCNDTQLRCITEDRLCDGNMDCNDGSDERDCCK